jgi:hypothetical protein
MESGMTNAGQELNVKLKSVMLWGAEDILSSSIENMLHEQEDWKITTIANGGELDDYILSGKYPKPDIVITVQQENQTFLSNLHVRLLQDHANITLIVINLESNLVEVYSKQKILIQKATDLMSFIAATV